MIDGKEVIEMQKQIWESIALCEGRIDNGAEISDAFGWLKEEIEQIFEGKKVHDIQGNSQT